MFFKNIKLAVVFFTALTSFTILNTGCMAIPPAVAIFAGPAIGGGYLLYQHIDADKRVKLTGEGVIDPVALKKVKKVTTHDPEIAKELRKYNINRVKVTFQKGWKNNVVAGKIAAGNKTHAFVRITPIKSSPVAKRKTFQKDHFFNHGGFKIEVLALDGTMIYQRNGVFEEKVKSSDFKIPLDRDIKIAEKIAEDMGVMKEEEKNLTMSGRTN